jgi:hypothetical protein
MKTSRKALTLMAVLALAGCGSTKDPGAAADQSSDKSPLAEYMGEGFVSSGSGPGVRMAIRDGGQGTSEEELAKQRQIEDATVACMKAAGFDYVAVPPESQPKSKFNDALRLPADKFAEQYGYGISTIDWSKAGQDSDSSNPNTKIRNALSPAAKKAYDKALNGPNATGNGNVVIAPEKGEGPTNSGTLDLGCRGKAAEQVYGKRKDKDDLKKYDALFKDLEALRKRIEADQRVVDATTAWSDCLADAGHPGYKKTDEPPQKVSQKLDELTGTHPNTNGPGNKGVQGPPSFDKVDAAKLADLRKFEIQLAKADQKCRAKVYDAPYKKAQYELEKEFVNQHKAELEAFRDEMANR